MSAMSRLMDAMNDLVDRTKEKALVERRRDHGAVESKEDVARTLWDGRDSREELAFELRTR